MTTSPNSPISIKRAAGLFAALAVAATVMLTPSPSFAQTAPAARGDEVRIELKGQTPEAARQQIAAAARDVCRDVATHSPLFPRETSDCRRETEKQAIAQLGDAPRQMAAR